LPRRDADEALEMMGVLALIREAGVRGDLCEGQVRSCLEAFLDAFDAASDDKRLRAGSMGGTVRL
jgi:hypothetical protein